MAKKNRFAKQVYIRLADDGEGFLYRIKYGWFCLPTRHVRLLAEEENLHVSEVPVIRRSESSPSSEHQANQ